MTISLAILVTVMLQAPADKAPDETIADQAVRLVNQGDVERGADLLREHLRKNETDVRARVILGRILDFDGRPDEAVTLWQAGLTGRDFDWPLLMSIGEIRKRQGNDGPTITYRRGTVTANPSKDKAEEERIKRSHLADAATTFEKAAKLRPDDADAAKSLAAVYSAQERFDDAAKIWKSLVAREPKNGQLHLELAQVSQKGKRTDEAQASAARALELNPRLAEAHELLAAIQKQKGQAAEAEQSRKRAEFYKRLPRFSKLLYTGDMQKVLDSLDDEESVRKLIDDPSEQASELLAVLCWSHPHNVIETRAFRSLEARGAATTPLLQSLLESAQSTCTIRSTAHILARRKVDGLFERLSQMLPGDMRVFGMDMDIAGSFDDLGDPRAVEPLVQMLNSGNPNGDEGAGLLIDRQSARARAALALGAFDTPEARRALEAGIRDKEMAPYCLAALYRITKDPKRLAALETTIGADVGFSAYLIGNYLSEKVGTVDAKKLAKTWEAQRAAKEAAEKAKQERDSSKQKDRQ